MRSHQQTSSPPLTRGSKRSALSGTMITAKSQPERTVEAGYYFGKRHDEPNDKRGLTYLFTNSLAIDNTAPGHYKA